MEVAGRPFALHQLDLLRSQGFRRVVYCVGHLGEQVQETLGDGSAWGMDLNYSFDGPVLLGTGGALRKALPYLGEAFLVMYGDSYLDCDYAAVAAAFRQSRKLGLMTVFRNSGQWDKSNVLLADGRIVTYDKESRSPELQHIDYGLGALQARVFEAYPPDQPLDLAKIYQDLLARDELAAFEVDRRFYEIGSPAGLEETREFLKAQPQKKLVFLDRDGVINKVVMRQGKPASPRTLAEFVWEDDALSALARLKKAGFTIIVVTNQPDIARGTMAAAELAAMTQAIYAQTEVDAVYVCPHDDQHNCQCRKPRPGMLQLAARSWGVDGAGAFFIGDSWKDMAAGAAAGCRTILLDRPYNQGVAGDYRVPGLSQAVEFILRTST
jgi:histidinol-phosphate phosphatase family protein